MVDAIVLSADCEKRMTVKKVLYQKVAFLFVVTIVTTLTELELCFTFKKSVILRR